MDNLIIKNNNPVFIQCIDNSSLVIEKRVNTESYTSPLINSLINAYIEKSIKQIVGANNELDKVLNRI